MRARTWGLLAGVIGLYFLLVFLAGFEGPVALAVHLGRVSFAIAVLILYVPSIAFIFAEVPSPRRDYLLAGITLTWLSATGFSFWNEAGRVFNVDTSIFRSPVAGFFSLLLVLGAVFHLIAPGTAGRIGRGVAVAIGLTFGVLLVFVAPLFRG